MWRWICTFVYKSAVYQYRHHFGLKICVPSVLFPFVLLFSCSRFHFILRRIAVSQIRLGCVSGSALDFRNTPLQFCCTCNSTHCKLNIIIIIIVIIIIIIIIIMTKILLVVVDGAWTPPPRTVSPRQKLFEKKTCVRVRLGSWVSVRVRLVFPECSLLQVSLLKHYEMIAFVIQVACSSWKHVLLEANGAPDHISIHSNQVYRYVDRFDTLSPVAQQRVLKYFKFIFVRHPFERLVSAHTDKFVNPKYVRFSSSIIIYFTVIFSATYKFRTTAFRKYVFRSKVK